jgi:hypothetical protein
MNGPKSRHRSIFLLALLMLTGSAGSVWAQDSIFAAARNAVATGRFERSKAIGSQNPAGAFVETPSTGAVLVGFDLGVGTFVNYDVVYAIRPVYMTESGESYYHEYGLFSDRQTASRQYKTRVLRTERIRAPHGYAVGGLTMRTGLGIDGLSVTFMRISGKSLDASQQQVSAWIGNRNGGSQQTIGGGGAPVIGVHGSQNDEHVRSLGLVYMITPRGVASAPVVAAKPPALTQPEPPAPTVQRQAKAEAPPAPAKAEVKEAAAAEKKTGDEDKKAAETPASATKQPQRRPFEFNWVPLAAFGGIAVPLCLILLFTFGRKPSESKTRKPERQEKKQPKPVAAGKPPPLPKMDDDDEDEDDDDEDDARPIRMKRRSEV